MGGSCWTKNGQPKRRYSTRRDAKRARKDLTALTGNDPGQPYHCTECDYFHLGHYPASPSIRQMFRDRHRRGAA